MLIVRINLDHCVDTVNEMLGHRTLRNVNLANVHRVKYLPTKKHLAVLFCFFPSLGGKTYNL
jgi:hypothetical protein